MGLSIEERKKDLEYWIEARENARRLIDIFNRKAKECPAMGAEYQRAADGGRARYSICNKEVVIARYRLKAAENK